MKNWADNMSLPMLRLVAGLQLISAVLWTFLAVVISLERQTDFVAIGVAAMMWLFSLQTAVRLYHGSRTSSSAGRE